MSLWMQFPALQLLQSPDHFEALTDKDVATTLCDLPYLKFNTYDCSRTALCSRIKARLEADFKFLQDHL